MRIFDQSYFMGVVVLDNVEQLRHLKITLPQLTPEQKNEDNLVLTKGQITAGDGRDGEYYFDPDSNAADDNFYVIKPNSNPDTGRWKHIGYDTISPHPHPYVKLQENTPGTQQTGHFNVSGTGIIGTALGIGMAPGSLKLAVAGKMEAGKFLSGVTLGAMRFTNDVNEQSMVIYGENNVGNSVAYFGTTHYGLAAYTSSSSADVFAFCAGTAIDPKAGTGVVTIFKVMANQRVGINLAGYPLGSLHVAGAEPQLYLGLSGVVNACIASDDSITIAIDADNTGTGAFFAIKKDGPSYATSTLLTYINESGHLGLNCTPSALWSSSNKSILQLYGGTKGDAAITIPSTELDISRNAYRVSGSKGTGWKYFKDGNSALYSQFGNIHYFYSAQAGLEDAAISFFEEIVSIAVSYGLQVNGSQNMASGGAFTVHGNTTAELFKVNIPTGSEYIQANGKVGINCTPSSDWYSGVNSVIDMYGSSEICSISNYANHCDITVNAVQTAASEWKYRANSFATKYMQTAGGHAFYTATLGLKDDIISFNTGLTIDNSNIVMSRKVGINCTPSAWDASVNSVEEMYGTAANGAITQKTKYLRITKGAVETGDGTWVYQNSAFGYATKYNQSDGAHWFSTATLGANGAALTWIDSAYIAGGQARFNLGKISGFFSVNGETTDHLFYVNYNIGAEYIQANGKVGINCTPSAWHSTVTGVFEEYGLIGNISLTNLLDCWRLAAGATQTGADPDTGWVFNNSAGVAHKIHLRGGSVYFAYGGIGTVGNPVTWIDNFTFNANSAGYIARGFEPYINLVNTTHEDTFGGRESRIYGKGYTSTGVQHDLGYHEFCHGGEGVLDKDGWWRLYLSNAAGASINLLNCLTSGTTGYVQIPGMAGTGGFVKNSANGLLTGNNGIVTTDITGLFANPTATIGLTVVNGSATSAMRSDAAPALSQAIIPTWTGDHLWGTTKKVGFRDAALYISSKDDGYLDFDADTGFRFNTGKVGINCTPSEQLDINDTGNVYAKIISSDYNKAGLILQRGTNSDVYGDWKIIADGGDLDVYSSVSSVDTLRVRFGNDGKIYMYSLSDLSGSANKKTMLYDTVTKEIGYSA